MHRQIVRLVLVSITFLSVSLPARAQCPYRMLLDPAPATNDLLGEAVAVDGDLAVVGGGQNGQSPGEVVVFHEVDGEWVYETTLGPFLGSSNGQFGTAVDIDGDEIVVGAPYDSGGKVSLYRRTVGAGGPGWSRVFTAVNPSPQPAILFGFSVAIDGDDILVGAPGFDGTGTPNSGLVYAYRRLSGDTWGGAGGMSPVIAESQASFGHSVDVHGGVAIVGSPFYDGATSGEGSAEIFVRQSTSWSREDVVSASDAEPGAYFGTSVAIVNVGVPGSYAVVGAPGHDAPFFNTGKAYVFDRVLNPFPVPPSWVEDEHLVASDGGLTDAFGDSVAIYSTGNLIFSTNRIVVGATGFGTAAGAAYVFERSGGAWTETDRLTVPGSIALAESVDVFGSQVLAGLWSLDRDFVDQGAGVVFELSTTGCPECRAPRLPDEGLATEDTLGSAVALCGDFALVGVPDDDTQGADAGAVRVYQRFGECFELVDTLFASDAEAGDHFGSTLGMSSDGQLALVGAPEADGILSDSGVAYLFRLAAPVWSEEAILSPAIQASGARFSASLAVEGCLALVGQPGTLPTHLDHVSVFEESSPGLWNLQSGLVPLDTGTWRRFGASVAFAGPDIVVGADGDDDAGSDAGAIYLFSREAGSGPWTQAQKVPAPVGTSQDGFGSALAYSAGQLLVGAPGAAPSGANDAGLVYHFVHGGGSLVLNATLQCPDAAAGAGFGYSLAFAAGRTVIGAPGLPGGPGEVCTFRHWNGLWTVGQSVPGTSAPDTAAFGRAVATDGTRALVGAPDTNPYGPGSGWVYELEDIEPPPVVEARPRVPLGP